MGRGDAWAELSGNMQIEASHLALKKKKSKETIERMRCVYPHYQPVHHASIQ